ncbi:MAG: DNA polymerase III subunit beta [Bacteroidia bacterium]
MNFIVSSAVLARHLSKVSGAIPSRAMPPIIANFLFEVGNNVLTISTTNLESSMQTRLEVESRGETIKAAVPPKILLDIIKALPEQPLTFNIDEETFAIEISSDNGNYKISGENGENFPTIPSHVGTESINMPIQVLLRAINKVLFAASADEDRAALNGMFFELGEHGATFVATDAHRLVRYIRPDVTVATATKFIIPQKALLLVKNSLDASDNREVTIHYNENNAFFLTENVTTVCRLIDQKYPNYSNVIPADNPHKLFISKSDLQLSLRRVNIFANKVSHQVRFSLKSDILEISAEDDEHANAAKESLRCQYDGEDMDIGFNAAFLADIVANADTSNIVIEMSAPNRAGIVLPEMQEDGENMLMLIMPIMLSNH